MESKEPKKKRKVIFRYSKEPQRKAPSPKQDIDRRPRQTERCVRLEKTEKTADDLTEEKKLISNEKKDFSQKSNTTKSPDNYPEMRIVSEERWDEMSDAEKASEYQRVLSEYVGRSDESIVSLVNEWNELSGEEKLKAYKDAVFLPALDYYYNTGTGYDQFFLIDDDELDLFGDENARATFEWYFQEQMDEYDDIDEEGTGNGFAFRTEPLSAAEVDEELNIMGYDSSDVDGMSLEERREYIEYLRNHE